MNKDEFGELKWWFGQQSIKPTDDNITIVYLDFPSGKKNNTNDARKILKILHEHLK